MLCLLTPPSVLQRIDALPKITHVYYKRHEPDPGRNPIATFFFLVSLPSISAFVFHGFNADLPLDVALLSSFACFYASLLLSVSIYRLAPWHPLAQYPGPIPARLTKLWGLWVTAKGKNHIYTKKLHEKYGPCVRIGTFHQSKGLKSVLILRPGPNAIAILDEEALESLYLLPRGPSKYFQNFSFSFLIVQYLCSVYHA